MPDKIPSLIKFDELFALKDSKELILIDARTGADAKKDYLENHLAGALFVDLNNELADIKGDAANGGRHPLPSPENFSRVLQRCGITPESRVVVYDDKQGANAAARFWWMLKAAGHENVQVLDGGLQAAVKAGFPTSGREETVESSSYQFEEWKLPTADLAEVKKAGADENFLIIDVREAARYRGETEPLDKIAGHIPNAKNIPFAGNLDENGFFLAPEKLREKYAAQLKDFPAENIIVHCGSGVTACHTLLALTQAGFEMPKLYVGSWSEWSRNNLPIATTEK